MTRIKIEFKNNTFSKLEDLLEHGLTKRQLKAATTSVLNSTATQVKIDLVKRIQQEIWLSKKDASAPIRIVKDPKGVEVVVDRTPRPSLKRFPHKQTGTGVSYKVNKKKGWQMARHAFIVNELGRHVYRRTTKKRLPIYRVDRGASPLAVYKKQKLGEWVEKRKRKVVKQEISKKVEALIKKYKLKT